MTSRITGLTDGQWRAVGPHVQEWIRRSLDTTPADRGGVEAGIMGCYEYAGLPRPRQVVWVESPLAGALAFGIASHLLTTGGAVGGAVDDAMTGAVRRAVDDAVYGTVDDAVARAVTGAVAGAVAGAVLGEVRRAVSGAVGPAVHDTVLGAVLGVVRCAVDDAMGGAVYTAVHGAVRDAVSGEVHDEVRRAVSGAVTGAVDGAVLGAVTRAVARAVDGAMYGAVLGVVRCAVNDAASGAGDTVRNMYPHHISGQHWAYWMAYTAFFRDHTDLDLPGDLWDRSRMYEAANMAGPWWPHNEFVVVCERPVELHLERVGPDGRGSHRLHNATGPAIRWRDGWAIHSWHGVTVPEWVITNPTTDKINNEGNTEIRRAAIEAIETANKP